MAKLQGAIPATTHQLPRMVCRGREVQGLHEGGVPSEDLQDVARLNGPNVDGILATCKILASCGQFRFKLLEVEVPLSIDQYEK